MYMRLINKIKQRKSQKMFNKTVNVLSIVGLIGLLFVCCRCIEKVTPTINQHLNTSALGNVPAFAEYMGTVYDIHVEELENPKNKTAGTEKVSSKEEAVVMHGILSPIPYVGHIKGSNY